MVSERRQDLARCSESAEAKNPSEIVSIAEHGLSDVRAREELRKLLAVIEGEVLTEQSSTTILILAFLIWFFASAGLWISLGLVKGFVCFVIVTFCGLVPSVVGIGCCSARRLVNEKYHDQILLLAMQGQISGVQVRAFLQDNCGLLWLATLLGLLDYTLSRCGGASADTRANGPVSMRRREQARDELAAHLRFIERDAIRACAVIVGPMVVVFWFGALPLLFILLGLAKGLAFAAAGLLVHIILKVLMKHVLNPRAASHLFNRGHAEEIVALALCGHVSAEELRQRMKRHCPMLHLACLRGALDSTLSQCGHPAQDRPQPEGLWRESEEIGAKCPCPPPPGGIGGAMENGNACAEETPFGPSRPRNGGQRAIAPKWKIRIPGRSTIITGGIVAYIVGGCLADRLDAWGWPAYWGSYKSRSDWYAALACAVVSGTVLLISLLLSYTNALEPNRRTNLRFWGEILFSGVVHTTCLMLWPFVAIWAVIEQLAEAYDKYVRGLSEGKTMTETDRYWAARRDAARRETVMENYAEGNFSNPFQIPPGPPPSDG